MKILIAPDSFKGSLRAPEAAEAMRRGAERAGRDVETVLCPLSDGGEGFLDVLVAVLGGTVRTRTVVGPLGSPVHARWALLPDHRTAIIESAEVVGLGLVPEAERNPTRTTTYGVGELVREALSFGARRIVVGLGGTGTTDGGAGMAQALGVRLHGVREPATGGDLVNLSAIDVTGLDPGLAGVDLVAALDVDHVLTGPDGAATVYGPQKGATDDEVRALDAALDRVRSVSGDAGERRGDGAAGGLAYGLRVLAGARYERGADVVLSAVSFDERARGCDLVLTGEGRLDAQSARGKVVGSVGARSLAQGIPVIALAGAVGQGAHALHEQGVTAFFSLCQAPLAEAEAWARASGLLEAVTENVIRFALARRAR